MGLLLEISFISLFYLEENLYSLHRWKKETDFKFCSMFNPKV